MEFIVQRKEIKVIIHYKSLWIQLANRRVFFWNSRDAFIIQVLDYEQKIYKRKRYLNHVPDRHT